MFVNLLAEQTMEPYSYTGNNPIMFTDLTGMSKEPGGDPKKTKNKNNSYATSLLFTNSLYKPRNTILKMIGQTMGVDANLVYMNVSDSRGGNYNHKSNTITVTNNAFKQQNIYDVMSVIEHELIHQKDKGVVKSFRDHVRVYKEQANTETFKKTSKEFKSSHAVATAQRMINGYVSGDYDSSALTKEIKSYNDLNPDNKLIPQWEGNSETTSIKIHTTSVTYDKDLTPSN